MEADARTSLGLVTSTITSGPVSSSDPVRQLVVTALEQKLETILTASGYRTNLGSNVFTWKPDPFQSSEVPGCDVQDGAEETGYVAVGEHWHKLSVNVRIVSNTEASVRQAIADVVTCVGMDVTLAGIAEDITLEADGTISQDASGDTRLFGSLVKLTIEYATLPYTP